MDWKTVDCNRPEMVDVNIDFGVADELETAGKESTLGCWCVGHEQVDVTVAP